MLKPDDYEVALEDLEGVSDSDKKECLKAWKEVDTMAEALSRKVSKGKGKKPPKIKVEYNKDPKKELEDKEKMPKINANEEMDREI